MTTQFSHLGTRNCDDYKMRKKATPNYAVSCKVQIFWKGHKNLAHLTLIIWRYKVTKLKKSGRWAKFLWPSPSHNTWTLATHNERVIFNAVCLFDYKYKTFRKRVFVDDISNHFIFFFLGKKILILLKSWGQDFSRRCHQERQ